MWAKDLRRLGGGGKGLDGFKIVGKRVVFKGIDPVFDQIGGELGIGYDNGRIPLLGVGVGVWVWE